ncbi:MAG: sel1 repeat family protein [Succinivibrio sp.]|nr:sel1 repeat family protein [Succinivibrio sp.]
MSIVRYICAATAILLPLGAVAVEAQYDIVTSSRAMAARDTLENTLRNQNWNNQDSADEMYTNEQLNRMIEDRLLYSIVRDRDKCQFTPDIEDRARLVGIPVFMYAWGDMLLSGVCVKADSELGLEYLEKAAENAYAPALERLSFYYEKGYLVGRDLDKSERYMHTAAVLGSKTGRLGWADMLVRGFGTPALYEEAFSWLYHSTYNDPYDRFKQQYLQEELEKRMPPNVVARDIAYGFDY